MNISRKIKLNFYYPVDGVVKVNLKIKYQNEK